LADDAAEGAKYKPPRRRLRPIRMPVPRYHRKRRLFEAGLKENRCERRGIREWRGEPLVMALHHLNGVGNDNRFENLLLMCPNCHSQTENFAGRNAHTREVA
jgi:hypothetical protein